MILVHFVKIISICISVICRIITRICVVYPAERNRFTGEPIMIITQVQKTIINETVMIEVVIYPTKIVVLRMMIGGNVKVVVITEIEAEIEEVGTMISVKHLWDHRRTRKVMTGKGVTRIIIIGTIGGIVIAIEMKGIGVGIAAIGREIAGTLGMIDRKIVIGMNARVITRRRIARDQGHDRETVLLHHLER